MAMKTKGFLLASALLLVNGGLFAWNLHTMARFNLVCYAIGLTAGGFVAGLSVLRD